MYCLFNIKIRQKCWSYNTCFMKNKKYLLNTFDKANCWINLIDDYSDYGDNIPCKYVTIVRRQ